MDSLQSSNTARGGVSTFTPQTDVYALGATLFNLLTGTIPPHYSEILEDGLPELPSSITESTKNAIERAMEIRKNKRPANMSVFLENLNVSSQDCSKQQKPSTSRIQQIDIIHNAESVSHKIEEETVIISANIVESSNHRQIESD